MIEGFVVRSTVADGGSSQLETRPPYRPGSPFFFKVKFEEPYLLYRTWREVTRVMLPLLNNLNEEEEQKIRKRVKGKTKRPEVEVYVNWVDQMLIKAPKLFDNFDRGVVRVRERFLRWTEKEGKQEWEDALAGKSPAKLAAGKVQESIADQRRARIGLPMKHVIVPMAIPGCGASSPLRSRAPSHLLTICRQDTDWRRSESSVWLRSHTIGRCNDEKNGAHVPKKHRRPAPKTGCCLCRPQQPLRQAL